MTILSTKMLSVLVEAIRNERHLPRPLLPCSVIRSRRGYIPFTGSDLSLTGSLGAGFVATDPASLIVSCSGLWGRYRPTVANVAGKSLIQAVHCTQATVEALTIYWI